MLSNLQSRFRTEVVTPAQHRLVRARGRVQSAWDDALSRLPPRLHRVLTAVIVDVKKHDLGGLAAELAYRMFLALFPFLILLATVAAFVSNAVGASNPADTIVNSLGSALPKDTADFLRRQINDIVGGRSAGLLSFGLAGTLWASAGGVSSIIKATNRVWGVEDSRPVWKRSVIAVGLTLSAGVGLLLAFVVLVGAQVYGAKLADAVDAGPVFAWAVAILRFPIAIALIMVAVAVLYWAAPYNEETFGWASVGAVVFTISWLIATSLFGLYVSHFGSYNKTYGALGGVIVLLVWLNVTCFLLLLGSEINAVMRRDRLGEFGDSRPKIGRQRDDAG